MPIRSNALNPQQGVTLLVVMVMLVVIGFVSVSAMRRATNADFVANNTRLEQLAKQSAQAALRYCESEIIKPASVVKVQAAKSEAWTKFGNWQKADQVTTVTEAFIKSADMPTPKQLPQCMAEYSPVSAAVIIITARGFSPDYKATASGETESGSVVWLQSIVSLQS